MFNTKSNAYDAVSETNQNLPTDVSYVDVSEISVSDNSDVEWNLDSYTKSPAKKRLKVQPKAAPKPSVPSPLVKAPILIEEPHVDIVDESCTPASNWEGVKGAKNILESYFNPYLQGIQQEKLWLNSSPVKEQETPVKRQEETESLTSIAEDKAVELPSLKTPSKSVNKIGPMHSTPMPNKQTQAPRRSPRKRSRSEMEDSKETLDDSGVVTFKESAVNPVDTTPVSCKSPPAPKRKLTPQSSLNALKSQKKSVPKHIPAEVVLTSNKSVSEASYVVSVRSSSSKKLITQKSHVRKSYSFDYIAGSSKKQCSQKVFDKIVQDYHSKKESGDSLDKTLPNECGTSGQVQEKTEVDAPSEKVITPDTSILAKTPGIASNVRLSLTIMKSSKKGCLCHEHTADSPCPLAKTPKKQPDESAKVEGTGSKSASKDLTMRRTRGNLVRKRLTSTLMEEETEPESETTQPKSKSSSKLPQRSQVKTKTEQKSPRKKEETPVKKQKSPTKAKREKLSLSKHKSPGISEKDKESPKKEQEKKPQKSPRKNLAKLMLETVGRNTRKSSKRKRTDSGGPYKRKTGINEYDFSSGLDF